MRLLDLPADSPVALRIKELAVTDGISDFYLTPGEPLAYRHNGELIFDSLAFSMKVPADLEPGCHDSAMELHGYRFRVSQMLTRGRLRWVLRLLPSRIPEPDTIQVPPPSLKAFLEARNGLFLICGATGSGKSTTIASMVLHRAQRRREHVITFEDPIEFIYPGPLPSLISQREMGGDEQDFAKALRSALRQAPDVIIVGEIRDGETAEIALQAAETGHVVVATLHTSSASQTVQRFLKLIPGERVDNAQATLADTLRLILCQRLLFDATRDKRFPIHEVLLQYDGVTNIIRRGDFKKLDQELETGWKRGMNNFDKSIELREADGFHSNRPEPTGFSAEEVRDYLDGNKAPVV
ncbi:MAG: ATPase, T2SS/T4P/T4SS family [Terrimicrobiaceae bacterium]|nr:ATPase, T2SS/T4P/T4SS family [Terrimicrobiaceae bacterium]